MCLSFFNLLTLQLDWNVRYLWIWCNKKDIVSIHIHILEIKSWGVKNEKFIALDVEKVRPAVSPWSHLGEAFWHNGSINELLLIKSLTGWHYAPEQEDQGWKKILIQTEFH